ncbi:hypothetical protein BKA65DRAFT_540588 [Rhexocercosporidium sp. MPI-PUGE-AT-0058]|nr:hypothetical protein BKA65DRAFT_540588 [Rhexocercosporidium sp. MPI-PUGE-AT-0058]
MTNKGLHISLPLIQQYVSDPDLFLAHLRCCFIGKKGERIRYLAVLLLKTESAVERYRRVRKHQPWSRSSRAEAPIEGLFLLSHDGIQRELRSERNFGCRYIYVNEERSYDLEPPTPLQGRFFSISTSSLRDYGFTVSQYHPLNSSCVREISRYSEIKLSLRFVHGLVAGVLFVNDKLRESIILAIVVRTGYLPCLFVITSYFGQPLEETAVLLSDIYIGPSLNARGASSNSLNSTIDSGGACVADSPATSDSEQSLDGRKAAPERRTPLDRMSQRLRSGTSVSASLRHTSADGGGRQFLIDIGIDLGGAVRWPAPSWVEILLLSISINILKVDDQDPNRSTAERHKKRRHRRRKQRSSSRQPGDPRKKDEKENSVKHYYRHRSKERSRGKKSHDGVPRRDGSWDYRRPESREYSQGYARERSRERRPYDISLHPRDAVRDGKEWILSRREPSDR